MEERIKKANKVYCDEYDRKGVKICCWDKMPGWQSFLRGEITEAELCEQAKEEMSLLEETFGKYLRDDPSEESAQEPAEGPPEDKAKIANRIYRQACVDSGKNLCFFKDFATWQQFVHGEIDEKEFYEKASEEAKRLDD